MKKRILKLNTKICLVNFSVLLVVIISACFLSHYLYERLYMEYVGATLIERTEKIVNQYEDGLEIEELCEKIEWFSSVSHGEIVLFCDAEKLKKIIEYNYDLPPFSRSERQAILNGEIVSKILYNNNFRRDSIVVAHQLKKGDVVEGILFFNTPLNDLTKEFLLIWGFLAIIFVSILSVLSAKVINRLMNPLKEMKWAASEVSKGNYDLNIHYESKDEIGSLARAFNKMSRALQEEDERRRGFLSDVSHELRTPLSYIKGYTHLLLDGLAKDPKKQSKYLKLIVRETNRMENFIQSLLDLTKLESNSMGINQHPLVLGQCIEDVMIRYRDILRQKHLSLNMNIDPDVIINGDEVRLEQIIQNVVDNAIQYSVKGGIIEVSLSVKNNKCVLKIADDGIGISEQDLMKVTERFYRVNKARTRIDGGTGIGLSIVEKLMKLHGGEIVIESQVNVGTKVYLFFPLIDNTEKDNQSGKSEKE